MAAKVGVLDAAATPSSSRYPGTCSPSIVPLGILSDHEMVAQRLKGKSSQGTKDLCLFVLYPVGDEHARAAPWR